MMRWLQRVVAKGILSEWMNGTYVRTETFQVEVKSINKRIDDFQEHMDTRFDDLKETFKNNGH